MKLHFENIKNVVDNFTRYYTTEASLAERMSANLSELASFVAVAAAKDVKNKSFFTEDTPFEPYMPNISPASEYTSDVLCENLALAKAKLAADESAYIADFCDKITKELKTKAKIKPSPALLVGGDMSKTASGTVAFAESRILVSAFAKFQKKNPTLTPTHVQSFNDACEDVSAGLCDYCILPIENSREGTLLTVFGLIERHELFISRVCSVENNDITTKFALLCRNFRGIIDSTIMQSIVLRISLFDQSLWSGIYTGANVLGVKFIKSASVPLSYSDGYAHICTFSATGETLFAFLLFLSAIRTDYTIIGLYDE